jgi:hypothetical protein
VAEGDRGVEPGGELKALVLEWDGRHRHPHVLRQEGDEPVDVADLIGPGEPGGQFGLSGVSSAVAVVPGRQRPGGSRQWPGRV